MENNATYKIHVSDLNYSSWEVFETTQFQKIHLDIDPSENKLFSNDVFTIGLNNSVTIVHSSIRSGSPMPGVLVISGNKTYGRKYGKLLYKCLPDDKRLPPFLIPYEILQPANNLCRIFYAVLL